MAKARNKRLIIILIAFGIFLLYVFSRLIYTMINDQETSSRISLQEYDNLFDAMEQNKLQLLTTTKSRNREATSSYIYDKKFNVFVLKVKLKDNNSLKAIIDYKNEPSYVSMNAVYSGLPSFNFDMDIKAGKSVLVSSVHFKYNGDSIVSIMQRDNLYCYYFKFKTFSINYNEEPYDIIAKADGLTIPASLAFIKKDKSLYIIIMTLTKSEKEMQQDLLYSILNK